MEDSKMFKFFSVLDDEKSRIEYEYKNEFFIGDYPYSGVMGPVLEMKFKENAKHIRRHDITLQPIEESVLENVGIYDCCLTNYFKGKKYGPAIVYRSTEPIVKKDVTRLKEMYVHNPYTNPKPIISEKFYIDDKAYGYGVDYSGYSEKMYEYGLDVEYSDENKIIYFDDKQQLNKISYLNKDSNLETWYFDGELQSFGRILYKDGSFKYVKISEKGDKSKGDYKITYDVISRDQVKVENKVNSYVENDIEFKSYDKIYYLKECPDIVITLSQVKDSDGELCFTEKLIYNKKTNRFYRYRKIESSYNWYNREYVIVNESSGLYCYRPNKDNMKEIAYGNGKFSFSILVPITEYSLHKYEEKLIPKISYENKKFLMNKYPSNYDFEKKYFGKNTLYTRLAHRIQINEIEKHTYEEYYNNNQGVLISKYTDNDEKFGKALILFPSKSVHECFCEDGEWTEFEFVDYFESLSDVYEYFNE